MPRNMPLDRSGVDCTGEAYPLTALQQGMLFHSLEANEAGAYVQQFVGDLCEALDVETFHRAWRWLAARHDVLRTRFVWNGESHPRQIVGRDVAVPWFELDWHHVPAGEHERQLNEFLETDRQQGFDLGTAPLFRVTLFRLDKARYRFVWTSHHAILDGRSRLILVEELFEIYTALRDVRRPTLSPKTPFREFIQALQDRDDDSDAAYWCNLLSQHDPPRRLDLSHRPSVFGRRRVAKKRARLPKELTQRLATFAASERLTLNTLIQGAWSILLSRYTGQRSVIFGAIRAGRSSASHRFANCVGLLINTVPVPVDVEPDAPVVAWLRDLRAFWRDMRSHEQTPLVEINACLPPSRRPIEFDSLVAFERYELNERLRENGPAWDRRTFTLHGQSNYPLVICGYGGEQLILEIEHDTARVEDALADSLLAQLQAVLRAFLDRPNQRVSEVPLLSPSERRQLLELQHGTRTEFPRDKCVQQLFEEQVARAPDHVALIAGDREVTYQELNARANHLAHHLRSLGVQPNTAVGICMDRSVELIVGLLAILKAGGAYLPLDPDYPVERLELLARDGEIKVVVTRAHLTARLPLGIGDVVEVDAELGVQLHEPNDNLQATTTADDLAYVLYTSGSTGRPKGVAVRHRSIVRLLFGVDYALLNEEQRILQLAPVSFDASTFEIWGALLHGGRLVLAPPGPPDLEQLSALIARQGINTLWLTAALFNRFVETRPEGLAGVRQILTGGEALSVPHVRRALEHLAEGAKLVNGYGPTECTTFTCCYEIPRELDPHERSIPIGRPIANTEVFVLDDQLRLLPPGVPGELCVGGHGLARGYWRDPERTAERFVPHPFSTELGARLYRTGDRVCWRSDGNLEFLGRHDDQVKLRGYRIELGEIEQALQRHTGVAQAVATLREDRPGDRRLVAYYLERNGPLNPSALRSHLSSILPTYMIPSVLVRLETLPLTPSGKVDRQSLPAPKHRGSDNRAQHTGPRNTLEETLCSVWSDVLGVPDLGVHDNFFELGGHSLLATQAVARVSRALNVDIALSILFDAPTVAEFATLLAPSTTPALAPATRIPRIDREHVDDLPLSFAQQRLWFTEQVMGEAAAYNIPYVVRLRGPLNVEALRRGLETVVERHEPLRTTFRLRADGTPEQVIGPARRFHLPVLDLVASGSADPDADVEMLSAEEAVRPFDLSSDLMLRASLLRVRADEHVLLLTLHHIACDGWSVAILWSELGALYDAYKLGERPSLPALAVRYADFAAWQRDRLRGARAERLLDYWRDTLDTAPATLELPTDHPRETQRMYRGEHLVASLPPELTRTLRAVGLGQRATLFMVLLSAFQILLQRWSGQDDFVIGAPVSGRPDPELDDLIGLFLNPLPLRARLAGNPVFRELLCRVRDTALAAYSHQEIPFEMLVDALQPERSLTRSPLFQIAFNGVTVDDTVWTGSGITGAIRSSYARSKFDVTVYVREQEDETELKLVYDADLFAAERMQCLLEQYVHLLAQIAAAPDEHIDTYTLVTPASRPLLPDPSAELPAPDLEPVIATYLRCADREPHRLAVMQAGMQWSYADLRNTSSLIADHLLGLGIKPGDRVAVAGRSSFGVIASMVAVLECGGVLVLLDERLPVQRRRTMAAEVEPAAAILVERPDGTPDLDFSGIPLLQIDQRTGAIVESPTRDPHEAMRPTISPEWPAYIFFTSGTTGVPKGILGSHKGLSHFLQWQREAFAIGTRDRVAQLTGLSFDVILRDVFLPLTCGGTICLPPEDVEDRGRVWEWLHDSGVSVLHVVPSRAQNWLRTAPAGRALDQLRLTFFAGEPLTGDLTHAWHHRTGGKGLIINLYGPTETTLVKTAYCVPPDATNIDGVLSAGRPLPQAQALVLNAAGRLAGLCEVGEVAIRTPFRSLGYINPEATESRRFIANPHRPDPQDLIYLTGDIGRYRPNGELEILGRADDQIKILGLRIEPAEVSAALGSHPEVDACHVVARKEDGQPFLVAYVLLTKSASVTPPELRRFLAQRLPAAMIPRHVVTLDRMPLTPNGKVDRSALPAHDADQGDGARYTPPRNPIEEGLVAIWQKVLDVPRVGVTDDFFGLGGHSLLAALIATQASAAFGVDIKIRTLFEAPTIAGLAAHIGGQSVAPAAAAAESRDRVERRDDDLTVVRAPLSFGQERLWFIEQLESERAVYNMAFGWRLRGSLDVGCLRRALETIVDRHEPLRTTYQSRGGVPTQVIQPIAPFELPSIDLTDLPFDEREAEIVGQQTAEIDRPFDLTSDLMLRATVIVLGAEEHVLLLTIHHIAFDGWSFAVFWRELKELYRAYRRGQAATLPKLEVRYVDYAARQRQELRSDRVAQLLDYWRVQLDQLSPLELPTDQPTLSNPTYRGARADFVLDAELVGQLGQLSRSEAATLNMTLLAGFQGLLQRETDQTDIVVGMPVAGRDRPELAHHIGFFVNTLVIRTDLSGSPSFRTLLHRVRQVSLDAYDHRELPFERLVAELRPERQRGRNPLVQVVFQLHDGWERDMGLENIDVSWVPKSVLRARFDLEMHLRSDGDALRGTVVYSSEKFSPQRVQGLVDRFERLLRGMVADPDRPISTIPLLSASERDRVLVDWNDTAADYPVDTPVHQLFEQQVAQTPTAVAVTCKERSLCYEELDRRAAELANHLRVCGVAHGDLVGVSLDRSLEMIVAVLGIWKAGAAYLPLDPAYPDERLAFMVRDAGVSVVISESALAHSWHHLVDTFIPVDTLDTTTTGSTHDRAADDRGDAIGSSLAYVMYTSGSTGRPKGVRVPHRCVVNFLMSMRERPGLCATDVVLAVTSLSFDISVLEIFLPLITGARVAIAEAETVSDGRRLAAAITACSATVVQATPSTWRLLIDAGWSGCRHLKAFSGGEALPPELAAELKERVGQLWNLYGPTETTVWSTCGEVTDFSTSVPVGRPVGNTQVYVLDASMQPVPVGIPGELYIGGAGVTDGYLNRDHLTGERFISNPFANGNNDLLYRTGDRARWRTDGQLEILDRMDRQLKIRGQRIEPGEIETTVSRHPAIAACAVEPVINGNSDVTLKLFVIYRNGATPPSTGEIRRFLRSSLPSYMVPNHVVSLKEFPQLPNGKIDRAALRKRVAGPDGSQDHYVGPRTPIEAALTEIWSEVLGVSRVGVEDDFFELGGHSLLIADVVTRMQDVLDCDIPLHTLFEHPTIARLLAAVGQTPQPAVVASPDSLSRRTTNPLLVPIHVGSAHPPLFLVHAAGGIVSPYVHLANRLGPDESLYGIEHPGMHGETIEHSIPQLAALYCNVIRESQPHGPYLLGGWSFGGLVAYEAAQQLTKDGADVRFLALLDSFLPAADQKPSGRTHLLRTYLRHYGLGPERTSLDFCEGAATVDDMLAKAHEELRRTGLLPAKLDLSAFVEHFAIYAHAIEATGSYHPSCGYPGQVTLVRSTSRVGGESCSRGWADLSPANLVVYDVAGDHYQMLQEPWVATVAEVLQSLLHSARNGRAGT